MPVDPPAAARVRRFALAERGGWVFLWGGDSEAADEARLPPFEPMDTPDFAFAAGCVDYDASYEQVNANLLDFTHLGYVHAGSFLGEADKWADALANVRRVDNGVAVTWWVQGALVPPEAGMPPETRVDQHIAYQYLVPGHLSMWIRIYPLGTAEASGFDEPVGELLSADYNSQSVAMTDERRSRYFFTWGVPAAVPDAAVHAEQRAGLARRAFTEDKTMIEAQQRIIDRTPPGRRMRPNPGDKALTLFERLMAARAAEPSGTAAA